MFAALRLLATKMRSFAGSRIAFHVVVGVLLFVPHLFGSAMSEPPYYFGIPRIASGDEPHYLVFVHSIIEDGDLSLANNYQHVHEGADHAGWIFRGGRLNHHTIWYVGDRRIHWFEIFGAEDVQWSEESGHPAPVPLPTAEPELYPVVERPWNSPGLPILLSPIFFLFRGTGWIEPVATILAGIAVLLASLFWRMLARTYTDDQRIINLGVMLTFLGTPAWHYGRSFFSEPFLLCIFTAAYALALTRGRPLLAGLLIGMALFIKPVSLLIGAPLGVLYLVRREIKNAVLYACPVALWLGIHLLQNRVLYGGFFHTSNQWVSGFPLFNFIHMILNPQRGLLTTGPILLVAAGGWIALVKSSRASTTILAAVVTFTAIVADNRAWSGGFAYSLRFLVPLMPLFCLGLVPLLGSPVRRFVLWVGALSIVLNALAAVQYWRAFHNNPVLYLVPNSEYVPK